MSIVSNLQNLIENLPNTIEELELGPHFNLKLNDLPNSVKIIKIKNRNYNKELNCLPSNLELLELPKKYDLPIKNINPNCIIKKW